MNDELAPILSTLPEPTLPSSMTASVMARIAREADLVVAVEQPRERPTWLWSLVGLAVVIGAAVYGWATGIGLPDVLGAKVGGRLAMLPMGGPLTAVMAAGVLVYLGGLFAPLHSRSR
ncbi:MAG: hypothetical protein IT185_03255 [Acidobacteria bacterium]|jgi:hypothetical protein|nr:hypothetical protein [Acidobacteriota bacterium]